VTAPSVNRPALKQASLFLRQLSSARQDYTLYPVGHPKRVENVHAALGTVRKLRALLNGDPTLFVSRHALYLGPVLLARDTLARYGLVDAFEKAGVEAVEILSLVTDDDIDKLIQILVGQLGVGAPFEGIALNRIKPGADWDAEAAARSSLRRSYALGLEVLRHTSAAVMADEPVDLEAASRVVQELSDLVVQDPTQALMLATVRSHDEYTYYHMLNVCLLTIALGVAVGLLPGQIVAMGLGALLHDVGKVNVPVEILQHVGALTPDQWRLVQRHPVDGAGIIFGTGGNMAQLTAAIVLEHHAAYDLTGYPKLSGRPHPSLPSRMVAVADCFDAVTTTRPYRRAEERRQALNILLTGAGRGYDPRVVRTFVRLQGLFPVGSLVRLTDRRVGVVVRNHDTLLARPKIRVLMDPSGTPCEAFEIDLAETRSDGTFRWEVERSMDPGELGVDMMSLILSGDLEPASAPIGPQPGLVHEPAHGEPPPPGYEDASAIA
jgi:HD-GYP domain-containing protein (c-di-GMP phosphodiesterase class II)